MDSEYIISFMIILLLLVISINEPQFYCLNCGSWLFCFVLFIRGYGDRRSYDCRSRDRRMHGLPRDVSTSAFSAERTPASAP